jgi:hypothetical protein
MTANVPINEIGKKKARLQELRWLERLRKETENHRLSLNKIVKINVNLTSSSIGHESFETHRRECQLEQNLESVPSKGGDAEFLMVSTTSTVFVPGWR